MYDRPYNPGAEKILNAKAELNNKELWSRFSQNETEMIITKTGRRIFPILKIDLKDLEPQKYYCILLEMQQISPHRLKFTAESGWTSCGVEETQHPGVYVHPDSPSTGEYWMTQTVNFEKCKLTNSSTPSPGSLTLSSMHKYVPKIILVQTENLQQLHWSPSKTFFFKETEFVAVTAYQNNSITALKIDHNPFAKGFRENGKSRCKKKLLELEMKRRSPITQSSSPHGSDVSDPSSRDSADQSPHVYPPPMPTTKIENFYPKRTMPVYPVPVPAFNKHFPLDYNMDPYEYYHNQIYLINPYFERLSVGTDPHRQRERKDNQTVKKLTDFSIKNIIGEA